MVLGATRWRLDEVWISVVSLCFCRSRRWQRDAKSVENRRGRAVQSNLKNDVGFRRGIQVVAAFASAYATANTTVATSEMKML
ncbi:hypothetical protein Pla52o_45820 [Novipirellula galeiformis]|uniref:Uncharacterized protein n=1 Tax=Novipirellula galeiformis TaxID=2528004 RepID=A0A5C6C7S6_9BACT|nr:hypothetical protein Pla52o_45820 [Novipirellula galeiformis]